MTTNSGKEFPITINDELIGGEVASADKKERAWAAGLLIEADQKELALAEIKKNIDKEIADRLESGQDSNSDNESVPSRASSSRIELSDSKASEKDSSPSSPGEGSGLISPGSSPSFLPVEQLEQITQDNQYQYREVVIDRNGQPRQAGADSPEGEFIKRFRTRAEQSLFVFLKGILGRFFLTPHFHQDICNFIQACPPFRKLVLMPREHAKTAIVSGGLPLHIIIQPAATNIYFPGMEGSECRILLTGENSTMAEKNLRVNKSIMEENKLFRAFWPHRCWIDSKPKIWSSDQIIIPRKNEWPDPTIKAVGVGGAITGARPNVMIKDDLVSFKAMNSEVVMREAIDWHVASRALLDTYEVESGLESLEFIIGCLTADSIITMSDGTPKKICDIQIGDEVLSPSPDKTITKRKVEAVIPQGFAKILTIEVDGSRIKATPNHPFLISTGKRDLSWIRADKLKAGDQIVSLKMWEGDKIYDEDWLWLLGFMTGDGWYNVRDRRGYVCFSAGVDEELNQRVLAYLKKYVSNNKWYLTKGGYYRCDTIKGAKILKEANLGQGAKTKRIPLWVYSCNCIGRLAFLRGMIDADGSRVQNEVYRVEIANEQLIEDLKHLSRLCGVRVGCTLRRVRKIKAPNSKNEIEAISYSASFNLATIERTETANKNNYGGLNIGRDTKLLNTLRFSRVQKITENKIEELVWDLTVEGEPAFFANGLAVHNTRWAVFDLYSYIMDKDPSVEVNDEKYHRIISDGKILWPEKHTIESIDQLRLEHGSMFFLLYLNSAADPSLTDFDIKAIRRFIIRGGKIIFASDERDEFLRKRMEIVSGVGAASAESFAAKRGEPFLLTRLNEALKAGIGARVRGI